MWIYVHCLLSLFQVQYVRLVSTASTGSSNVVTVGKSKASTTLQTVGIGQKIGNQQQIVKVHKNMITLVIFQQKKMEKDYVYICFLFIIIKI